MSAANQPAARRSADTADQTQRLSFGAADIAVGRVITLTFDNTAASDPDGVANGANAILSMAAGATLTFGYTVQTGDSAGDVATAFHNLINNKIHASQPGVASSADQYVDLTAAGASMVFMSALDLGETTITIGISGRYSEPYLLRCELRCWRNR